MSKAFIPPCREGLAAYCPEVTGCPTVCLRKLRQNDTDHTLKSPTVLQQVYDDMRVAKEAEPPQTPYTLTDSLIDPLRNHNRAIWTWVRLPSGSICVAVNAIMNKTETQALINSLQKALPALKD